MAFNEGGTIPQKKKQMIFSELIAEFIEQAQVERTTRRGYGVIARRIAKTVLGEKQISKVRRYDIDDYIRFLQKETHLKNATINKDLDLIGEVFAYAERREYIKVNPAYKIQKLKEQKFRSRTLCQEELVEFTEKLLETGDNRLIMAGYLALFQGLRRGEICGLRWEKVSFPQNTIFIRETITQVGGEIIHKPPKTEESVRDLEIHPETKRILKEYQIGNRSGFVINRDGNFTNPTWLSKRFKKFVDEAGFVGLRFHDLRHTFATLALEKNVPAIDVSGALGHSSVATTLNIYTHPKALEGSKKINKVFGIN